MILSGEFYATAALAGALGYVIFLQLPITVTAASTLAFLVALIVRGAAIVFYVCLRPPGEFLRIGDSSAGSSGQDNVSISGGIDEPRR